MAPQRVRAEDSRSEASSTKEKQLSTTLLNTLPPKSRRTIGSYVNTSSNLKDVTTASTLADNSSGSANAAESPGGINWASVDRSTLNTYRHAHRLRTPSAFSSPYNQLILAGPGLGRFSPTMARAKERRRVSKEELATAVRKDFNAAGVSEQEVVTNFLYSVHHQKKKFRMRFAPSRVD